MDSQVVSLSPFAVFCYPDWRTSTLNFIALNHYITQKKGKVSFQIVNVQF